MRLRWGWGMWMWLWVGAVSAPAIAQAAEYQPDDVGEVEAIQNRTYHLGQEFDLSLSLMPYDAFYKSIAPEGAYSFHFSDVIAWEAIRFGYGLNFDTNLKTQLLSLGAQATSFEEVQLFLASNVVWSPAYFKAALWNHYVIYGEFYGVLGAAAFQTTLAWRPAPDVGLGGRIFLNKTLSLKAEVREYLLIESGNLPSVVDVNLGLAINFGSAE